MPTVAEYFAQAMRCHQAGQLSQAEQMYQQILQADPHHADTHHLMGVLDYQRGRAEQAATTIRHAISLNPTAAAYHCNLGLACQALGKMEEAASAYQQAVNLEPRNAEAHCVLGNLLGILGDLDAAERHCRHALELRPGFAGAHNNLGLALSKQGKYEEAARHFELAIRYDPNFAIAHNNLGHALIEQGRLEEAEASFHQALRLNPKHADAHHGLGIVHQRQDRTDAAIFSFQEAVRLKPTSSTIHNNLGIALTKLNRWDEAAASFQTALQLKPDHPDAHYNLGSVRLEQNRLEEAASHYLDALALKPDNHDAAYNLGNVLLRQDKLDEASRWYQRALQLKPEYVAAENNLGSILKRRSQFDEALACFDRVLQLDPGFAPAHWNRAVVLLLHGEFEQGWPEYEWRWLEPWADSPAPPILGGKSAPIQPDVGHRRFPQPVWDGSDLKGRTIFLWAEQGLGDTIHFIRYAPLIQQRGGKVIVQCQAPLLRLLRDVSGVDRLVAHSEPLPAFDLHAPLAGLPGIFRTTLASVPAPIPYLQADPDLVAHWRRELRANESSRKFLVGIGWQGNPAFMDDHLRSIPLAKFAPLAGVDGVELVSLQKGPGTDQLRNWRAGRVSDRSEPRTDQTDILELGAEFDESHGPFMDTAAIMMNMDLVITSDTVIPHLAGALGVPVWLALAKVPDWRWLLQRDDSPWYPTMRLFRQKQDGRWDEVFDGIANKLQNVASTRLSH